MGEEDEVTGVEEFEGGGLGVDWVGCGGPECGVGVE